MSGQNRHISIWRPARLIMALLVLAFPLVCSLIWAGGAAADQAKAVQVANVRIGEHESHTRLVFDLSGPIDYATFTLADPYRVVIDMEEVAFAVADPMASGKTGIITGFRYGLFRPGHSRVVIDLGGPARVAKQFTLPGKDGKGKRFVLDLHPTDRNAFLETAGWPKSLREKFSKGPKILDQPDGQPKSQNSRFVLMLDPGHGGVDSGAVGRKTRLYEKDVVLDISLRVKRILAKNSNIEIHMTRSRDEFIRLRDRVRKARSVNADLFVSIHADSAESPKARGAGVYTLSEVASDKEAAALARKENRADIIAGLDLEEENSDVTSILIDLAQRESKNHAVIFTDYLMPQMADVIKVRSHGHRQAGFRVLKAPDVPSALIELGFLSNRAEEAFMRTDKGREQLAQAIAKGIIDYRDQHWMKLRIQGRQASN